MDGNKARQQHVWMLMVGTTRPFCKTSFKHNYLFPIISLLCVLYNINPYPTAFPYGNGMVLHFYQQQESSTTKTVHKVINKRLKTYV